MLGGTVTFPRGAAEVDETTVVDEGWVGVLAWVGFGSKTGNIVFGDTLMSKSSNTLLPSSPAFSAAWTLLDSGRKFCKLTFS